MTNSKTKSLLSLGIIYLGAIVLGLYIYTLLPFNSALLKLFLCDILCTLYIFIFSLIFKNPGVYKPFWGIAPMAISIAFLLEVKNFGIFPVTLVSLICVWGLRLTINFVLNFQNLRVMDFRYAHYAKKFPKLYQLINLVGFHLFPSLLLYIGLMPALYFILNVQTSAELAPSVMTLVALGIGGIAVLIETAADVQLFMFRRVSSNQGLVYNRGLWKNSRHPNYFGEFLFWFSLFLVCFSLPQTFEKQAVFIFCPLAIFLMFQFISIPLMDSYQLARKPAFKDYKESTNAMLIVFPPKNNKQ